jgi:hypothetical protein
MPFAVGFCQTPAMLQVSTADPHVLCMQTDLQKQEAAAQGKGIAESKSWLLRHCQLL